MALHWTSSRDPCLFLTGDPRTGHSVLCLKVSPGLSRERVCSYGAQPGADAETASIRATVLDHGKCNHIYLSSHCPPNLCFLSFSFHFVEHKNLKKTLGHAACGRNAVLPLVICVYKSIWFWSSAEHRLLCAVTHSIALLVPTLGCS